MAQELIQTEYTLKLARKFKLTQIAGDPSAAVNRVGSKLDPALSFPPLNVAKAQENIWSV